MKGTLLEGNIRRQLIALATPLLLGNVLQQLYNTADALIIERFMGTEAFSAVGIAGTIMNLFIFVLTGFCTGVSIIFAQTYGSGDRSTFRRETFVSVTLGAGVTLLLSAIFLVLMRPVLRMIHSPEELLPYIESYLKVIIGGMLATYFYNLFSSMLRAIGDTRASIFFLFIAVVVNVVLDYLFIGMLAMGISGAAWATVLSQLLSALLCLIYLFRRDRDLICTRYEFHFEKSLVKRTLTFGFSAALHQSTLYIGKILVQGAVNTLGTPGIAAYSATMRVEGFSNSFGTSIGQALSVFVSQNYGARNPQRVRDGAKQGIMIGLVLGAIFSAAMFFTARMSIGIFLDASETEAIRHSMEYMHLISLFYILCFNGNVFLGYFRGVSEIYIPTIATTLHMTIRTLLSYLLVDAMGLKAIALATGVGWIALATYQVLTYLKVRSKVDRALREG